MPNLHLKAQRRTWRPQEKPLTPESYGQYLSPTATIEWEADELCTSLSCWKAAPSTNSQTLCGPDILAK